MAKYSKRKREEARRLYLTGELTTVAEIARRLKTKPHTVGEWRREEDWDGLRLKIDRQASEKLVAQLANERVNLNARHYKFWDVIGSRMVELVKSGALGGEEIRSLDRLAAVLERMQRGQRLARGLSLDGQTEEQVRAEAHAELRSLVDLFVETVKHEVADEPTRDRICRAVLARIPAEEVEGTGDAA